MKCIGNTGFIDLDSGDLRIEGRIEIREAGPGSRRESRPEILRKEGRLHPRRA